MYEWWISDRSLNTYEQMLAAFQTARSPDKGKPVNQNFRLFMADDGKTIKITNHGYGTNVLAEVTPDNIITFTGSERHVIGMSQTYVSSFYRWFPFAFHRHRKNLYRIEHTKRLTQKLNEPLPEGTEVSSYTRFNKVMNACPSYFEGIKFNLLTNECLNKRPDDKFIEIPEKRKEWRRALMAFKKGIKARAKVHALDAIAAEIEQERQSQHRYSWKQPDWSNKEWLDLLEDSIRKNEYPKELLKGFVQASNVNYWGGNTDGHITPQRIIEGVDRVMNDVSIEMRRRFNVFEKEGHDEDNLEKYRGGVSLSEAS